MKKTVLTVLAAALMVASTAQIASAAERHHVRKAQAPVSQQVRNANNFVAPAQPAYSYSDYADGHAISAPAGR